MTQRKRDSVREDAHAPPPRTPDRTDADARLASEKSSNVDKSRLSVNRVMATRGERYTTTGVIADPGTGKVGRFRRAPQPASLQRQFEQGEADEPTFLLLRLAGYALTVFGIVFLVWSIVTVITMAGSTEPLYPVGPLPILFAGIFSFVICIAAAELIRLALHVADAVRK